MPVYVVTGKLGSGKTLSMVGRLRDYIEAGKPVAANIDIDVRALVKRKPKAPVVRLPDRPTAADFAMLGAVHSTAREELNGALVLDECGMWLNARSFADKGRQGIIDFLLHTRKLGWDVFLIVQSIGMLDKQLREALAEYYVICRRLDRIKIPFVGRLIPLLTLGLFSGKMPQVHLALVRYGVGQGSLHADTWLYRGKELYAAYQSVQVIKAAPDGAGTMAVEAGAFSWVWYATEAEMAKWPPKARPKLRLVEMVGRLDPDRAMQHLTRLQRLGILAA